MEDHKAVSQKILFSCIIGWFFAKSFAYAYKHMYKDQIQCHGLSHKMNLTLGIKSQTNACFKIQCQVYSEQEFRYTYLHIQYKYRFDKPLTFREILF